MAVVSRAAALVMISHRTILCSLAALLSLAVISYAQRTHAVSCVAPIFPQCLVDDSPVTRCGDSAASRNCVKELLQQPIAVDSSEFESAVQDCMEEIADEYDDEDTRADCYSEICSNVTVRLSAATESISAVRSRCFQEFVLMPKMTTTAVGRLVNNFVQQCKQDQESLATKNRDGAIASCMQMYVRTCFEHKSPRTLERCIDDAESMCETVRNVCKDDTENITIAQSVCFEAAEVAVTRQLVSECSQNGSFDTCEGLFMEILEDYSSAEDIAMLASVTKGLARFEENTERFLSLTEMLLSNLTSSNSNIYRLIDKSDARLFLEAFDIILDNQRINNLDSYQYNIMKNGATILNNLEMLSSALGRNLLFSGGRLDANFSYSGANMRFNAYVANKSINYESPETQSDDDNDAKVAIPTCYLCAVDGGRNSQSSRYQRMIGTVDSAPGPCNVPQHDEDCESVVVTLVMENVGNLLNVRDDSISRTVASAIISAQVFSQRQSLLEVNNECNKFSLEFTIPTLTDDSNGSNISCYFWDNGTWSTEGVETTYWSDSVVKCSSNHLTSFAVLLDTQGISQNTSMAEQQALQYISYIGCTISFISLVITIIFLIIFRKKLNRGPLLYVHINFCTALCLALLVFLIGLETATPVRWLCGFVAGLLHYLFLATFFWMLVEGIMLYLLVVRVFGSAADRWYLFMLLGWGPPILIVAITAAVRPQQYGHYGTTRYCWLSPEYGVIWAFVGPVIAIVCVNTVILVLTVVTLVRIRQKGGAEKNVKKIDLAASSIKSTVVLLPLLGITWIVGVFAVDSNTTVFLWIFTILNSLQGLAIFILHVLRSQIVLSFVKKYINKKFIRHHSSMASKETKDMMTKDDIIDNKLGETIDMADVHEHTEMAELTHLHEDDNKTDLHE